MSQIHGTHGGVTRRGLMKIATGLITSIPAIGGKFIIPLDAQAEESNDYQSEEYGMSLNEEATSSKVTQTGVYYALPYYVYYRVCDIGSKNQWGRPTAIEGARVTLIPKNGNDIVVGYTDKAGIVAFNIQNVADNVDGGKVDETVSYHLVASILVNAEDQGYRTFETGYLDVNGGKASSLPLRKVSSNMPYPHTITWNGGDVLYTMRTGYLFSTMNYQGIFHVDFRNVEGSTANIALKVEGEREPIVSKTVRVKERQAIVDFEGCFQLLDGPQSIPPDKNLFFVLATEDTTYSVNIAMIFEIAAVGDEKYTEPEEPITADLPFTTNNKNGMCPLVLTFPEDWAFIGGSIFKPTLPSLPINVWFDPYGYFQLTATLYSRSIAKYDSAKDLKSQQNYQPVRRDADGKYHDKPKTDGGWSFWSDNAAGGLIAGTSAWSKGMDDWRNTRNNKMKTISAIYSWNTTDSPAGKWIHDQVARAVAATSSTFGKLFGKAPAVDNNGVQQPIQQIEQEENPGNNNNGLINVPAEGNNQQQGNNEQQQGDNNNNNQQQQGNNEQQQGDNNNNQQQGNNVIEIPPEGVDPFGDDDELGDAQSESDEVVISTQAEEYFTADLAALESEGLLSVMDDDDVELLTALYAQVEYVDAVGLDYDDVLLTEDSTPDEKQKAFALTRLEMFKDILRDEKKRIDRLYRGIEAETYSTQCNFEMTEFSEEALNEERARYIPVDKNYYNFYANAPKNFDPWKNLNDSYGTGRVPFAPNTAYPDSFKKHPLDWLNSFFKKWGHVKLDFKFSFGVESIAKWKWPSYDSKKDKWKQGSILANIRLNLTISFSISWAVQLSLFYFPIIVTFAFEVSVAVLPTLAGIRQFEAQDLTDTSAFDGSKSDQSVIARLFNHSWVDFFDVLTDFDKYELDYASTGLILTITVIPSVSAGLGTEQYAILTYKLRFIITFIISCTLNKYSKKPEIQAQDNTRKVVTLMLGHQFILDAILFTNTWAYQYWPTKDDPRRTAFYDSWAIKESADVTNGSFTPNTFEIGIDKLSQMNIVDNEMMSKMSEMDGEQAIAEQSDDEVFDWESVRENDFVKPVADGSDITYKVLRMPEYDEEDIFQAQAIALGLDTQTTLGVNEITELGGNSDGIVLGAQDGVQSGVKKAPTLRRYSTVLYSKNSTGLLSMADEMGTPDPDISGLSKHGWLNPTDILLTPEKPVAGDPHMKVVEYATVVRGTESVLITAVFRLCTVEIDGKSRSRIMMSLLDAHDMYGNKLGDEYQEYLIKYDKRIIDFDVNDIKGINRSDMYDYEFDVKRKTIVEGDGDNLGSDMLQLVVVSGVRKDGDNTTMINAATDTVFTYITIPVQNLLQDLLVYDLKISILGNGLTTSEGEYHLIRDVTIQGGETVNDNYAIIAFEDRASQTPEGTMGHTTSEVSIAVGFMLVDFIQKSFLIPNVEDVTLNLGSYSVDPRITHLSLYPKIGGYYLLALQVNAGNDQAGLHHYFLVGVPDELDANTEFFAFDKLQYVTSEAVKLVPCPARDCYFAAYENLEESAYTQELIDLGREVEGTEYTVEEYDNGTVYSPSDYEEYVKQFDKKRELHKVWFEGADGDSPVMKDALYGPTSFSVHDFNFNTNGTFIFWPENSTGFVDGEEGLPLYGTNEDGELYVADTLNDDGNKSVIRASRIHENLNGEVTFSDPFIIAEVDHEVGETVVASARSKYSPLTLLSKAKMPLQNEVGDDYFNDAGETLYPGCNIYFTAIPNVNSVLVDNCESATGNVTPGCNAIFDVTLRNVGNTYLSGCTVELCVHYLDEEGVEHAKRIDGSVSDLVFDSESIVQTEQTPIDENGKMENVEDDFSLAPGKIATYRICIPIPEDYLGDYWISAIASKPIMAEHGGLSGLVDDEEEIVYMDYCVEPGEYDLYSFMPRVSPDQPKKKTYMMKMTVGYKESTNSYRDAPMLVGDASITEENGNSNSNGNGAGNSANNSGANNGAAGANGGNGVAGGMGTVAGGSRQATAKTADSTSSVLPAAVAAAGAAAIAYERRRAKNEKAATDTDK